MTSMMLIEDAEEAAIVAEIFNAIRKTLDDGKDYKKAPCFDECAYLDGRGEYFSDFPNSNYPNPAVKEGYVGAFPESGLVRIPYGSPVYVYRSIGGGEAVYDIYSFGYRGKFEVVTDLEGDLAGLVNSDYFPF